MAVTASAGPKKKEKKKRRKKIEEEERDLCITKVQPDDERAGSSTGSSRMNFFFTFEICLFGFLSEAENVDPTTSIQCR